jgi:hypothetical protein
MKRSLNYTGRRRLPLTDVAITITSPQENPAFDATLNIAAHGFPETSRVFVEAYRRMEWMRFDFGTIGHLLPPPDRRLTRFESLNGVLFRVRVVSPEGSPSGKLLGEADRIPVQIPTPTEQTRRTLLPLVPESLQGELFRLDLSGEPLLLVERELGGDWQAAAGSPLFESLVYPSVLRAIVEELLREGWPDDDEADWHGDWARFAESLPGFTDPPAEDSDRDEWIDTVVEAFCRAHRMLDRFNTAWTGAADR